jgi:hypothetical protein
MITYFVLWYYLLIQGMAHNTGVLPLVKGGALHRQSDEKVSYGEFQKGNAANDYW